MISQGVNWALTTKYGKYGIFKNKNMTKIWDFGRIYDRNMGQIWDIHKDF